MQTVSCVHCGSNFEFDPNKVWNSPGQVTPLPGSPTRIVIQCARCQRWIKITLQDNNDDESDNKGKKNGGNPSKPVRPGQKR
jgi:hypothetical protein